jgi:hypothetical protein
VQSLVGVPERVAGGIIPPAISHLAVATPRKLALRSQELKKLAVLIELLTCKPFYFSGI